MDSQTAYANKAYVEEVSAQLLDMAEGERRILPLPPRSLTLTNMYNMLQRRGWFIGRHFITGSQSYDQESKERLPVDKRRRFFIKIKQSVAAAKLAPVDSM